VAVKTASFSGITPGVSTIADVQKAWGAPAQTSSQENMVLHLYRVEPFRRVEAAFRQDKVVSIIVRLDQAFPADKVAQQLQLGQIHPVLISNESGEILGEAFPERGVMFAFQESNSPGKATMMVTEIILETITAEPFILRAETRLEIEADSSLQDLNEALKLAPQNARAHWLRCRVLADKGDLAAAAAAVEEAVRLEPDNPRYMVTRGQILGALGRFEEAIQVVQRAVQQSGANGHVKARALCMLGDLYGSGTKPDYRQAIQYHTDAIKAAAPLAADRYPAIRLAAKEVLIDAHLGAAHDIAWGNWNQKEAAIPRWLKRAKAFAEELIEREGATPEHRLRVATRALAAVVGVEGKLDPTEWAEEAVRVGQELIASAGDAQKQHYEWSVGLALYDAVQIYQLRSENDVALKYGGQAAEYLEKAVQTRPDSPEDRYVLGRLYFRLGAINATGRKNHSAAVRWFEKAVPTLEESAGQISSSELGRLGETFVSMGVSYWETGQQDRAVSLTERGVELMEKAVTNGLMAQSSLEIPYGNLASMHRQLGQESEASKYLQQAARTRDTIQR
jgi:tetratricopeptide (TPR) repeat protein